MLIKKCSEPDYIRFKFCLFCTVKNRLLDKNEYDLVCKISYGPLIIIYSIYIRGFINGFLKLANTFLKILVNYYFEKMQIIITISTQFILYSLHVKGLTAWIAIYPIIFSCLCDKNPSKRVQKCSLVTLSKFN